MSKTNPFRASVGVYLGRTHKEICSCGSPPRIHSFLWHLPWPLIPIQKWSASRQGCSNLEAIVSPICSGIDSLLYSGHSLSIWATTTAAAAEIPEATTKKLGRWQSTTYLQYIKMPRNPYHLILQTASSSLGPYLSLPSHHTRLLQECSDGDLEGHLWNSFSLSQKAFYQTLQIHTLPYALNLLTSC